MPYFSLSFTLMHYPNAFNKTELAEQKITEYEKRLRNFREQMAKKSETPRVSVMRFFVNTVRLYAKASFCGSVLEDASLPRPLVQNKNVVSVEVSEERIDHMDGDVIFIWDFEPEKAVTALERLKVSPLLSKLEAVQNNRAYAVDRHWYGAGPVSANLIIDDLFKYLLHEDTHSEISFKTLSMTNQ